MARKNEVIAKMTEEQKIEICCDYMNENMTTTEIAKKYGIGFGTMIAIIDSNGVERRPKGNKNWRKRKQDNDNVRTFNGVPIIDGRVHKKEGENNVKPNNIDAFYDGEKRSKENRKEVKEVKPNPIVNIDMEMKKECECGCKYNPKHAKFCCACGRQLRTDKEIIIMKIDKLGDYISRAGDAVRDDFRDEILSIINDINTKL